MAYSGKLISIKSVVESAFMDAGLQEIDYQFAIETAVNLMGLIGVPDLYVDKITDNVNSPVIEVSNFRAKLPDDYVNLRDARKVRLNADGRVENYSEMIEASDMYHLDQIESNSGGAGYFASETNYPVNEVNEFDELETSDGVIVGDSSVRVDNGHYTYKIQGNYIFTNFKDGFVEMVYSGYSLDNEGFPMIPDDEKFKNALKYEIIYKIDWRNWRLNPASPGLKSVVNDSGQQRDWYVAAARTKGRIPTIGQMESIKNQWLRTIPKNRQHGDGFKTNNIGEVRYNQSNSNRSSRFNRR